MTPQKEPREFWIDPTDDAGEEDLFFGDALKEHPRQGPLQWQDSLIRVIEHSAYLQMKEQRDMAVRYLKKAQGAMIKCECHLDEVEEIDKILGELKDGGEL